MKHKNLLKTIVLTILFTFFGLGYGSTAFGQTFYDLSSENYSQDFTDISGWTNNYASGTGAGNWRTAASVATSTLNTFAVFVTGATGGVQKGTNSIVILATGTNSTGTDLLMNFTGRTSGTISLDWAKITNTVNNSNPRSSDLKIQYSTDNGTTFTDLTGYTIPRILNNSSAESGSLSSIALPSALDNQSQVVIRFFVWNNGQTGGSGSRPKFQIDNIAVTSAASSGTPGISLSAVSGNTTEAGSIATFTAVLNAEPATDVVLNISSADIGEVTVSPSTLTFTNLNWDTPQQITLTGVNDALFDGNQDVIITVSVDDSLSADAYDAVADVTRTVTNEDDDVPPSIGFDAATSSENETNVTFTSANIPITVTNYSGEEIDIEVNVTGGTTELGDYTFTSPTLLSFTGNGTQNITVDINDDADTNNETIIFTITQTSAVTGLIISQATHTLTIIDDEVPVVPSLIISEVTDPLNPSSGAGRFVEIYNNGVSSIDLGASEIYFVRQSNGVSFATLALTGVIEPNTVMTIGSSANSLTEYGFGTNFDSVIVNGNGNDGYFLYYGGDNTTGTLFDAYGVLNQDGTGFPWEYLDKRAYRNSPKTVSPNATWTLSEWTVESTTKNVPDMTPGALENEFRYDGDWKPRDVYANATSSNNVLITSNVSLTSNLSINNFDVNPSINATINSGVPLIVNGTSSGNVTYNRNLGTENWYLVSSPVVGEAYDNNYIAANSLAINGANNAIGSYTTADNTWSYMQTGGGATFTAGQGYSVRRATSAGAGNISFTGTINTADVSFAALTGYNLLGNPFTSYLNGVSFINGNSANIDGSQIWVWNQANGNYDVKNLVTTIDLAPAQGFFVNTTGSATVNMAKSYQQSTGSAFQKTAKTEVQLLMTDGTNNRYAKVFYLDNGTTGFDNGYDGETFGGIQNSFDVFTHLVANSEGKKYQVQSLPNSDFENMVVPVGIKAAAGKEITFSAEAMNIPDGINVYLEDRTANTVTLLSEANATYKVTLTESLDGIGRFYLHTKASGVLSTTEVALDNISIYSPAKSTLRIAGVSQGKASVKIYSVLGKQVFANTYNTTGVIDMNLPTLTTGLYVVQLETEKGTLNKKITLE